MLRPSPHSRVGRAYCTHCVGRGLEEQLAGPGAREGRGTSSSGPDTQGAPSCSQVNTGHMGGKVGGRGACRDLLNRVRNGSI